MGSSQPKPEFVSVLADQQGEENDDKEEDSKITLSCEAKHTEGVTAKWKKNGQSFQCVAGKHEIKQNGTEFSLEINNPEKEDEGNYTLTLENKLGSVSCSAMVTVELKQWRTVNWEINDQMITYLQNLKINNDEVTEFRFLLHGPVGAGKSSIINTIKTVFEGHQFINCLTASDLTGESFSRKYEKFSVGTLPLAFYDVMGLEADKKWGQLAGVHHDDIIKALKGHIPDDYKFIQEVSMSKDNRHYITNPTLNNQIHCLISVIPAEKVTIMDTGVIEKMKTIRLEASKLGIPQLVFLTRVDQACKMTQKDLTKIYRSKKIKEKMQECSVRLGVPVNCIFPVKNYHEETKINENLNCLMLEGLTQAVHSANDYVKNFPLKQKPVE